jgi:hypothetical protein
MRRSLAALLVAGAGLAVLEGTTGIGHTHPSLTQLEGPMAESVWDNRDHDIAAFVIDYVAVNGWVPRGERPEVVAIWRGTMPTLPDIGLGFGPDFYREPERPIVLIVMRGLINYRHWGMVEYRPRPPMPGQLSLLFDWDSGRPFFWGTIPEPLVEKLHASHGASHADE